MIISLCQRRPSNGIFFKNFPNTMCCVSRSLFLFHLVVSRCLVNLNTEVQSCSSSPKLLPSLSVGYEESRESRFFLHLKFRTPLPLVVHSHMVYWIQWRLAKHFLAEAQKCEIARLAYGMALSMLKA